MAIIGSNSANRQETLQQGTRTSISFFEKLFIQVKRYFNHFTESLLSVGHTVVDGGTDLFKAAADTYDEKYKNNYVENLHYTFDAQLDAITQKTTKPSKATNTDQVIELNAPISTSSTASATPDKETENSRKEIIEALEKIKTNGDKNSNAAKKIKHIIRYLNEKATINSKLDIVENAYVSTRLEAALVDLKSELALKEKTLHEANKVNQKYSYADGRELRDYLRTNAEKKSAGCKRLQTTINLVTTLERQAFLGWNHLANERKINALDAYYCDQFKRVGYSRSISVNGSLGVSIGVPVNVKGLTLEARATVDGAYNVIWMLDDEGYIAVVKTRLVGITAAANADILRLIKANAKGNGDGSVGEYYEVKTSREFVTFLLPELIRTSKHRNDPDIAPNLSRSATLAHAMADKGVSQSLALWAVTREESNGINQVKKEFDLLSTHNDMLRSLSLSSTQLDQTPGGVMAEDLVRQQALSWIEEYVEIQKLYSFEELSTLQNPSPIQRAAIENIDVYKNLKKDRSQKIFTSEEIDVTTAKVAKASLLANSQNIEANADIGVGINGVADVLAGGGSGSYTRKERVLADFKATSFCQIISGGLTPDEMEQLGHLIRLDSGDKKDEAIKKLFFKDTFSPGEMTEINKLVSTIKENSAKEKQGIFDMIESPNLKFNTRGTRTEEDISNIKKIILASSMNTIEEKQKIIQLIPNHLMNADDVLVMKEKILNLGTKPNKEEKALSDLFNKYLKSPEEKNVMKKLILQHRLDLDKQLEKIMEPIITGAIKKRESVIRMLEEVMPESKDNDTDTALPFQEYLVKKESRVLELLKKLDSDSKINAFTEKLFEDSLKINKLENDINTQFDYFKSTLLGQWEKQSTPIRLTPTGIALQKMSFETKKNSKELAFSDEQFLAHFEHNKLPELSTEQRWKILADYGLVKTDNATDLKQLRQNLLALRKKEISENEILQITSIYGLRRPASGEFTKNPVPAGPSETGIELLKMAGDETVSDEDFLAYFEKSKLGEKLLELRDVTTKPTAHSEKRWELLKNFGLVKIEKKADLSSDPKVMYELLKHDFKSYTDLHIRIAAAKRNVGNTPSEQDINFLADFAKRYGVDPNSEKVTEQVLHRMIIVNAHLYGNEEDLAIKSERQDFEQELLSPAFEADRDYLDRYACFNQNIDFGIIDNIVKASLKFKVVSIGGTVEFEVTQRERTHTNQLRDGDYWDISIKLTDEISDLGALITSIKEAQTLGLPPELREQILSNLSSTLGMIDFTGGATYEKAFLWRYFKPKAFGGVIPYKLLFYRKSVDIQMQFGIAGSIPTGLPFNFAYGLGYSYASTDSECEEFSSGTFIYALMSGMHEYAITPELKSSFDISKNKNWIGIKESQRNYFKDVFANYADELKVAELKAAELKKGVDDKYHLPEIIKPVEDFLNYATELKNTVVEMYSLSYELDAIEKELMGNPNLSQAQKNAFKNARAEFKKAVQMPLHDELHFQAAIASFENVMHAYSSHWLDQRANSYQFQKGYIPPLPGADLTARRQESRLQQMLYGGNISRYDADVTPEFMMPLSVDSDGFMLWNHSASGNFNIPV